MPTTKCLLLIILYNGPPESPILYLKNDHDHKRKNEKEKKKNGLEQKCKFYILK